MYVFDNLRAKFVLKGSLHSQPSQYRVLSWPVGTTFLLLSTTIHSPPTPRLYLHKSARDKDIGCSAHFVVKNANIGGADGNAVFHVNGDLRSSCGF